MWYIFWDTLYYKPVRKKKILHDLRTDLHCVAYTIWQVMVLGSWKLFLCYLRACKDREWFGTVFTSHIGLWVRDKGPHKVCSPMKSQHMCQSHLHNWLVWTITSIYHHITVSIMVLEGCREGNLTRAPLGYSAERVPLGAYSDPPCLTPEVIGAARRARRRSKALTGKIPMRLKIFI